MLNDHRLVHKEDCSDLVKSSLDLIVIHLTLELVFRLDVDDIADTEFSLDFLRSVQRHYDALRHDEDSIG